MTAFRSPSSANKDTRKAVLDLGNVLKAEAAKPGATLEVKATDLAPAEGVWLVVLHKGGAVLRRAPVAQELALDDINQFFETTQALRAAPTFPSLPEAEAALLDAAGFNAEPLTGQLMLSRSQAALDELMGAGSMSLAEAAKALAVSTSRLRQRLGSERTLYGIKQGGEWRVPLFQLERVGAAATKAGPKKKTGQRLVRNLDRVLPVLPAGVHPLSVRAFFVTENPDLVIASATDPDDEHAVSPLEWLSAGNPPEDVIALAREL